MAIPNQDSLARALHTSVSTVSRLRSGKRLPTWPIMEACRDLFGWPISDQAAAREANIWAVQFETRIRRLAG